jgi:hypothetical protein
MPKFSDITNQQQAERLMQPIYIRLLDNLRKHQEDSAWQGTFEETTTPYPGHQLCLSQPDRQVRFNLWNLCFQICCLNYDPVLDAEAEGRQSIPSF